MNYNTMSNASQACPCIACTCGENCQCTEALCYCAAANVMNSLADTAHLDSTTSTTATSETYLATWKTQMACKGCVAKAHSILGETATIDLSAQTATLRVESIERAQSLTLQLNAAGLDSVLVLESMEPPILQDTSNINVNSISSASIGTVDTTLAKGPVLDPGAQTTTMNGGTPAQADTCTQQLQDIGLESTLATPLDDTPETQTIEILVGGMTCSMCSRAVTQTLSTLPGIVNATVSLATNIATICYIPSTLNLEEISNSIEAIGYEVTQIQATETKFEQMTKKQQEEVAHKRSAFMWSLVGTAPIMCFTMILPHILSSHSIVLHWLHSTMYVLQRPIMRESLILWALATIVQFGSGSTFYKTSYHNLQSGQLGMDVLVALGTTASYLYALNETWTGQEAHFFETSSVLIAFVLLGKWMNSLAVRRTSEALTQLMQLQAKTAIQVIPTDFTKKLWNGQAPRDATIFDPMVDTYSEKVVSVDVIHLGDLVKILRGSSIPADGIVCYGEMAVDESRITGESLPVLKTPGSLVLGGTVCVETAAAFVSVTGVGANTALSQIVQLVQDAQTRQVPIQSLADSISSIFVPTACLCSIITFVTWFTLCRTGVVPAEWYEVEGAATFSLMFGIACLVISCPCALGLATPTAVMVGTGIGAKHGVLMKGGEALQAASNVTAVVFDKTGTLTKGKPAITDFYQVNEKDKTYLLWLLGSLERNSEHPLALAVVSYAEKELATYLETNPFHQPNNFQAFTGRGASGLIDGLTVAVGNRSFCAMNQIFIAPDVEMKMTLLEQQGKTAIVAAVDGKIAGIMGIADELKAHAAASLRFLQHEMGVEVWMVTGDNARTARAIARQLGLPPEKVISEALPVAKVQQVKKLQAQGKIVAMIGDGINDSPALAQADVGMSLGTGAEIAAEAADMVLVRGNVQDVCTALHLSHAIFRRIQWNLFFSLVYNCLGIPVAAGIFYPIVHTRLPPTLAALAMALSSLSVVSSSLALQFYQPPTIENHQQNEIRQAMESTVFYDIDLAQPLIDHNDDDLRMEEGL